MNYKISIIGNGNVASHLIRALVSFNEDFTFVGCYCRHDVQVNYPVVHSIEELPPSDIYIVAVSDDSIAEVTKQLSYSIASSALVLHTSGTKSIDTIDNRILHRGVLYPLQTFSSEVDLNMNEVPFFVECQDKNDIAITEQLALKLGKSVTYANSERRRKIHIAAVFACNFTNHLFSISQEILRNDELEFTILEPLIKESVRKALLSDDISKLQTGPAIRHDFSTIKSHTELLLNYDRNLAKIYEDITNSIIER